jgi:hypothetical protein
MKVKGSGFLGRVSRLPALSLARGKVVGNWSRMCYNILQSIGFAMYGG